MSMGGVDPQETTLSGFVWRPPAPRVPSWESSPLSRENLYKIDAAGGDVIFMVQNAIMSRLADDWGMMDGPATAYADWRQKQGDDQRVTYQTISIGARRFSKSMADGSPNIEALSLLIGGMPTFIDAHLRRNFAADHRAHNILWRVRPEIAFDAKTETWTIYCRLGAISKKGWLLLSPQE